MRALLLAFAPGGGRWDEARVEAERAWRLHPQDVFASAPCGYVLANAGQPSEGIRPIERALRVNPRDPHAFSSMPISPTPISRPASTPRGSNGRVERQDRPPITARGTYTLQGAMSAWVTSARPSPHSSALAHWRPNAFSASCNAVQGPRHRSQASRSTEVRNSGGDSTSFCGSPPGCKTRARLTHHVGAGGISGCSVGRISSSLERPLGVGRSRSLPAPAGQEPSLPILDREARTMPIWQDK